MPEEPRPVHPEADQNREHSPVGVSRNPTAGDGDSVGKATEAAHNVDMADARPDGKSGVDEAPGHSGNSAGSNTVASCDAHASRPQDDTAAVTNRSFMKQMVQVCSPMVEFMQLLLQFASQEPEPDDFVPDAVLHKTKLWTRKIKPVRSDIRLMCKHARHQNQARQEGAAKTDFNGSDFPQQAAAAAATGTVQAADADLPLPSAAQQTGTHPQKSVSSPKPAQARQTRSLAAATHTAAETAVASAQEAAPAAAAAPVGSAAASQPPQAAAVENADEKHASATAGASGVAEAPESLAVPQKRGRPKGRKAGTAAAAGDGQAEKAVVVEAGQPAVQHSTGAPVEAVSPAPPCTFA